MAASCRELARRRPSVRPVVRRRDRRGLRALVRLPASSVPGRWPRSTPGRSEVAPGEPAQEAEMSPRAGTGRRAAAAQQFTLNKRREDRKGLSRAADAETVSVAHWRGGRRQAPGAAAELQRASGNSGASCDNLSPGKGKDVTAGDLMPAKEPLAILETGSP